MKSARLGGRRKLRLLVALLGIAMIAAACGDDGDDSSESTSTTSQEPGSGGGDEGALTPVSVTNSAPTAAAFWPWKIMSDTDVCEEFGIEVTDTVLAAGGGGSPVRNVLTGEVTVGDIAFNATIDAYLAGAPLTVIAGSNQNGATYGFATRKGNTDIKTVEDWRGKTVGFTSPGSGSEAAAYMMAQQAGLEWGTDFETVAAGSTSASVALIESGDVDVGFYAEPLAFAEPDRFETTWNVAEYAPKYQSIWVVANKAYADENPETIQAIHDCYAAAVTWMEDNTEDAAAMLAEFVESDPAVIQPFLEFYLETEGWSADLDPEAVANATKMYRELIGVDDEIPWDELVDTRFLPDFEPPEQPSE